MNRRVCTDSDIHTLRCGSQINSQALLERRARILNAAGKVLTAHGYHATSMDSVAACSGMSKKTLYQFFASKKVLFETLIIERLFAPISYVPLPSQSMEEQLHSLITLMANQILNEQSLSLIRSIVADSSRNPSIKKIVHDLFRLSATSMPLEKWLQTQNDQRKLKIENVEDASDLLFCMTLGGPLLHNLTNCKPAKTENALIATIDYGIQVFLKAHTP